MPPVVSIPMAAIFYGLFSLIIGNLLHRYSRLNPVMAGFLIGYLCYDLTHYATHHLPMRNGYAKMVKRHHMRHHYKSPEALFGVSSPLWDIVFGTHIPERKQSVTNQADSKYIHLAMTLYSNAKNNQ